MKKIFFAGLVFVLLFCAKNAAAQTATHTIFGRVTSFEESLGLEGVSIEVKGSKKTSGTQSDGTYSIVLAATDTTLLFALDGYQTKELVLPSTKVYDIVLKRTGSGISIGWHAPAIPSQQTYLLQAKPVAIEN